MKIQPNKSVQSAKRMVRYPNLYLQRFLLDQYCLGMEGIDKWIRGKLGRTATCFATCMVRCRQSEALRTRINGIQVAMDCPKQRRIVCTFPASHLQGFWLLAS